MDKEMLEDRKKHLKNLIKFHKNNSNNLKVTEYKIELKHINIRLKEMELL